jgi:ABC-2 type transport system permease protein
MTAALAPRPTRTASASAAGGTRLLLAHTWVFARRNLEHIRQIPEKLLDVTLQPVMFVLLFAFVFGGAINVQGSNYREYLIGGILIQTLAFSMMGTGTAIATDLTEGVIDRFRSLPSSRAAYLLGHYLAELAGMILCIAVLLTTGFIVGWRTHASAGQLVQAAALLFVFTSAMIWIGTWIGMVVRTPDAVQGLGFLIVFPLTFLSNAFVPINSMPDVLQWVASYNPVSVLVGAVRELFGNARPTTGLHAHLWQTEHPVPAAWLYCLALLVIAVPAALRRYRRRTMD